MHVGLCDGRRTYMYYITNYNTIVLFKYGYLEKILFKYRSIKGYRW